MFFWHLDAGRARGIVVLYSMLQYGNRQKIHPRWHVPFSRFLRLSAMFCITTPGLYSNLAVIERQQHE